MSDSVLYDLTLEEALDILWLVEIPPLKGYLLSAVVRIVPDGLETWLNDHGQKLQVSEFDHPFVNLQYLTLNSTLSSELAERLAVVWEARVYRPKLSGRTGSLTHEKIAVGSSKT